MATDTQKKYAFLHCLTEEANNNKGYEMIDNGDGTFTAKWGRLEGVSLPASAQQQTYTISMWESKLQSKLKKGYVDRTSHRAEIKLVEMKSTKSNGHVSIISHDKQVADLIVLLQGYAKQQTAATYTVEAKSVTQTMIDDAQKWLDKLSNISKTLGTSVWNLNDFNNALKEIFRTIPRKMPEVGEELLRDTVGHFDRKVKSWVTTGRKLELKEIKNLIEKMIANEQSSIDSMASQVMQNTAQNAVDDAPITTTIQQTLLDQLGLEMELLTDPKIYAEIKSKAENNEQRKKVIRIFKVNNKATRAVFEKKISSSSNKKTELLFHGSRNANWFFIIQQGLKVRPSGAVITGAMFGNYVYFACDAGKSMGYTDGGRWTSGSANKIYMGMYEVHVGKQLIKNSHDSSCYDLHLQLPKTDCDSVWAKKGPSLNRDEFMVNSNQSTIKYLIEFAA